MDLATFCPALADDCARRSGSGETSLCIYSDEGSLVYRCMPSGCPATYAGLALTAGGAVDAANCETWIQRTQQYLNSGQCGSASDLCVS